MRRLLFVLTIALGLVFVPLGSAEMSFTDPAGDSKTAPDIRTVNVSNTESGVITFHVTSGLTPDTWVRASLAAAKLGVYGGEPYYVGVAMNPEGSLSTFTYRVQAGPINLGVPVEATASADAVTFSFPAAAFGIEDGFDFRMMSYHMASTTRYDADNMPDGSGVYYYAMTKPAPPPPPVGIRPVFGRPVATPAQPIAGKRFTLAFSVTRSDDGAPLATGTLACTTKAAGKVVPHRHTFTAGQARVTLTVPKAAKGKLLKIGAKVTANTTATKVFTFKIR
jgi:hypothetical protein